MLCKDRNLSRFFLHVCCGTIGEYTLKIYCDLCDSFTVQAEVIPAILESTQQGLLIGRGGYKPRDICVSAPTGSGKTLAFVIPVIQVSCPTSLSRHAYNMYGLYGMCKNEKKRRVNEDALCYQVLMERVVCEVRALAVLPTKELAQQVRVLTTMSGSHNPVMFSSKISW